MRLPSREHRADLPEHISPMWMPESPEEASWLVLCLELGYYPALKEEKSDLGLSETEVKARGA